MADDDRFAKLFRGEPGTVLGREAADSNAAEEAADSSAAIAKKKAADEKRLPPRRPERPRVPPGQQITKKWPILDLGQQPLIPLDHWRLEIKGAVDRPLSLNWPAFQDLATDEIAADIHCVTAWTMLDNAWQGLSARKLIDLVKPKPTARHVIFHSHDGYRTNVSLARFGAGDSLLALRHNGEPISREHGGPVRVVIPSLYFWKSAKWVRQITFLENDVKGYWEALGYHNEGDPWKEERYE